MSQTSLWTLLIFLLVPTVKTQNSPAQNRAKLSDEELLIRGDLADTELADALALHYADGEMLTRPLKREQVRFAGLLMFADHHLQLDWTKEQHARYLVEDIRLNSQELRSAKKIEGLDGIAIQHALEIWPGILGLTCKSYPQVHYYDLDGRENWCPD